MGSLLARNWWTICLRGAIALLFGLAVWIWPQITLEVLIVLFAAFALVGGVVALIAGLREWRADPRWWLLLLEGVVGIATGIVVFVLPNFTALLLLYVIAAWAIITGIFEIIAAIQMRQEIRNEWLLAIAGVASVLFGLLLTIWPLAGALAIIWLIGGYAIVFGILLLTLGFRLRSWRNQEPPPLL